MDEFKKHFPNIEDNFVTNFNEYLKLIPNSSQFDRNDIALLYKALYKADYLHKNRGMTVSPSQVIIGAGTEYLYSRLMEIETKFDVLNSQLSLKYDSNPIESIKTRIKSFESIIGKVERYGLTPSLDAIEENMNDIAGVRVICSFIDDIYTIADSFLNQDDITLIEKKDYIKNPKPSGYRSLHLIVSVPIFFLNEKRNVKVEVQLRTIAMDFWASLEHKLRYKKNIPDDVVKSLSAELIQCAEDSAALDNRMLDIRKQILELK